MRIYERLGKERAVVRDIAVSSPDDLQPYELLIFGVPTWGIGKLQDDWMDFITTLEKLDLKGKKVAMFGLGDQESYPDSFADAMGKLYDSLLKTGCEITGCWPTRGYTFTDSAALREGSFVGLVLDEENQPGLTDQRIEEWLRGIFPVIEKESLN